VGRGWRATRPHASQVAARWDCAREVCALGGEQRLRQRQALTLVSDPTVLLSSSPIDWRNWHQVRPQLLAHQNSLADMLSTSQGHKRHLGSVTARPQPGRDARASLTQFTRSSAACGPDVGSVHLHLPGGNNGQDRNRRPSAPCHSFGPLADVVVASLSASPVELTPTAGYGIAFRSAGNVADVARPSTNA
jgi:hypothetical protein